jgi:hypothetical protein
MSREEPGTSDAADGDINTCIVLCQQSRKILYNVHTFLKKLSSDDKCAKTDFLKTWVLTTQAYTIKAVLWIYSEAKISISSTKRFTDIHPHGKKHNMRKQVTNLRQLRKMFCVELL